jgi:hypothetical protein
VLIWAPTSLPLLLSTPVLMGIGMGHMTCIAHVQQGDTPVLTSGACSVMDAGASSCSCDGTAHGTMSMLYTCPLRQSFIVTQRCFRSASDAAAMCCNPQPTTKCSTLQQCVANMQPATIHQHTSASHSRKQGAYNIVRSVMAFHSGGSEPVSWF